jgi:pimeloyl-ACP methyl ester carboxylesterase
MKQILILLFIGIGFSIPSHAQQSSKPVIVFVHGAWGGAWQFRKVDSLLTEKGYLVYRPTLTGLGERVHLASTSVSLKTHILDVVNTVMYEDLHDIILVGHSYGGMVVTGVADSIPNRIKKLIYLDAFAPDSGESLFSILGAAGEGMRQRAVNGFVAPWWVKAGKLPPVDVPHPVKTLTDPLSLTNPARLKIPTTYILTVEKGKEAKDDGFAAQADRARLRGWPVLQLEADHNPQWFTPKTLVAMLEGIMR